MTPQPRVLLAEPDGPTLVGLRLSVSRAGFAVVGECDDRVTTVSAVLDRRPDVALIACDLPGGGIETAREVAELVPATRLVVLSADPSGDELVAAILAGATGYLPKDISHERLPHAVQGVLDGETALPRRHTRELLEHLRGRDIQRSLVAAHASGSLTEREWEVLRLLGASASTAEMALRLGISEVTVRRHISTMLAKLGLSDRASARALLKRSGV
jgi:DNA-binding NarL/FixJ family response regulator